MELIFYMNIPCDKTFPWLPRFCYLTLTLVIDPLLTSLSIARYFECHIIGLLYFPWPFLVLRLSCGYYHFWHYDLGLQLTLKLLTLFISFELFVQGLLIVYMIILYYMYKILSCVQHFLTLVLDLVLWLHLLNGMFLFCQFHFLTFFLF
jgi:hypothetical protein